MCLDYYYLMTKDIGNGPHLIGKLERIDKDNYQFHYMIKSDKFPNILVHIPDMDDTHKLYDTQETWHGIMRRIVPKEGSWACKAIMKEHNLDIEKYNVWDFLVYLAGFHARLMARAHIRRPFHDPYEKFYFYKEIPKRCYRYD